MGTAMGSAPVLREVIAGLATLEVDVLVVTGPSVSVTELGQPPANVRLETWVPRNDLLPHADQFTNADVVLELGVGDLLRALRTHEAGGQGAG